MAQQVDPFEQFADKEPEDPFAQFADPTPVIPPVTGVQFETPKPPPPIVETAPAEVPAEEPGFVSKAYDWATTGITDAPSRAAKFFADKIDAPDLNRTPFDAQTRGLLAGITQGVGDLVSGLTSPIDIAATALTGGANLSLKAGRTAPKMLAGAALAADALPVAHGATTALNPWSDASLGERGAGAVEAALGALGAKSVWDSMPNARASSVPTNNTASPVQPEIPSAQKSVAAPTVGTTTSPQIKPLDYSISSTEKAKGILTDAGANTEVDLNGLTNKQLVDLAESVKPGWQMPTAKPRVKVDSAGNYDLNDPQTRSVVELAKAKNVPLENAQADLDTLKSTKIDVSTPPSKAREIYDLTRGMLSVDLPFITSAGLRQGRRAMLNQEWWKAWAPSVRAYGSENAAKAHTAQLLQNKYFQQRVKNARGEDVSVAEDYGIKLSDINSKYIDREDTIRSGLAERIPFFGRAARASNRSYNALLNDIRVNLFEARMDAAIQYYEAAKRTGHSNMFNINGLGRKLSPEQIEQLNPMSNKLLGQEIADQVMNLTGRGKLETKVLGKTFGVEKHRDLMNDLMFSPGNTAAQIQLMDPRKYLMTSPTVRRQYLRSLLAWGISTQAMNGAAEMLGLPNVEMNPTSSDFLKPKIGNTRLDTAGGSGPYLNAVARLWSGETTSSTTGKTRTLGEGYRADNAWDVAQTFAANRLHPTLRLGYDLLNASEKSPVPVGDKLLQAYVPMIAQDAIELGKEDPRLLLLLPAISAGLGTQTYGKEFKQNLFLGEGGLTDTLNKKFDLSLPKKDLNLQTSAPGQLLRGKGFLMK